MTEFKRKIKDFERKIETDRSQDDIEVSVIDDQVCIELDGDFATLSACMTKEECDALIKALKDAKKVAYRGFVVRR